MSGLAERFLARISDPQLTANFNRRVMNSEKNFDDKTKARYKEAQMQWDKYERNKKNN